MHGIELNGIAVHCVDEGDRGGAPVLFANSLGTDFRVWDRVVALMPPGLRLIRYDKRGHGLTEATPPPYAMDQLIADAAALLDAMEAKEAVVVGLSIGGMIAQGLAAQRPDLVRAVVLMDTAAKIGDRAMWNDRIAAVEAGGIAALEESILQRWFSKAFHQSRQVELALWRSMLTRTTAEGYVGCSSAIRDADLTATTSALTIPALAMAGEEDGSTPPDLVAATAALIPGSRMERIGGAGHLPCVEAPGVTSAMITGFLQDLNIV